MLQIPGLYIGETKDKGRGVFAGIPINKDDTIEVCPIIIIPKAELPIIHRTHLHDYYFLWGEKLEECCIALGYGSLYNHELHPNANFLLDLLENTIVIEAIKDIDAGEEITINYHGEPGEGEKLWF